ncbi:MAG TPA: hypothetical protein VHI51_17870 [Ktedonobacterales bacterium]|jgi:hypothetical protein|nr:hypothetical protein [Ktedonobacterales bacterium]
MQDDDDSADLPIWNEWEEAAGAADEEQTPAEPAVEVIHDPAPSSATGDDAADAAFAALLAALRALPGPCAPPVGEGAFDILYASAREIVVWFVSAKDGAAQREVAIPARLAREAWALIRQGAPVDEAMLRAIAAGAAGGRWLLALFAQLPGVEVREAEQAEQAVTLCWRGDPPRAQGKEAAS